MQFEWDIGKAAANLKKHDVGFEEARMVFGDPLAKIFDDEFHSKDEFRELIVGHSDKSRLLIVCFTEREFGTVRIISSANNSAREKGSRKCRLKTKIYRKSIVWITRKLSRIALQKVIHKLKER